MKFIKASGMLGLMALAAATTSVVKADDAGWYMGGNIGQSTADIDNDRITENLLDGGFSEIMIDNDDRDTGYKLFGGYQFNRNFALEGGYFDLGEFSYSATTMPMGTLDGNMKLRGINLDLVGFIPFSEKFSAFGRVGVNYAEAKDRFSGTGAVNVLSPRADERDTNLKLGAGVQYAFTDALAMRVETERYRINDAVGNKGDIDMVSVGLVYRFGAKSAPVAVVQQPKPAPAPVAPPPPAPRTEKYTLSANELFTFDSSAVRQPQAKLDEIATALKGDGSPDEIVIVGYTDRLGSDDYNQKLSERRAIAVKNYLMNKGIESNRLRAEGRGEADPVVMCDEQNKAALISCLSPNRRVEIEKMTIVREVTP
ncbi:MAG: outer membrane beta-barrel protein [Cellvibrio sp.]|uniref:outer membrane beta-barrel protein n=1 Tax=Cellvibrio sp. TaxID=1965322 RepID=UPI00272169AB|nr:outer membrane beta-barrel protein [Cellvibrio sp.]